MKKLRRRANGSSPKNSKKSEYSSGASPKTKAYIFGALALAGAAYFMTLDPDAPDNAPMAAKEAPPKAVETKAPKAVEVLPEVSEPKQSAETLVRLRDRSFKNRELGIKGMKVASSDGTLKIPLKFTADKRWCQGGDLDTVKFMTDDYTADHFLISIESMTGKTRGDRVRVSANTLFSGVNREFKIALRNNPESIGLFICKDAEKKNSCRGKESKSHAELSALFASSKTRDEAATRDFQIYFQNFVVKDGELLTYDNSNVSADHANKLKSQLGNEYGLSSKDFNAAYEINRSLRSIPAKIVGDSIVLVLPYNDPRCDGRSGPPSDAAAPDASPSP